MSMETVCPICDAQPGEPCYDPHGDLPHKGKHHGRWEFEQEAALKQRIAERDSAHHQQQITGINAEIGKLIARRAIHEKALQEIRDGED